MSHFMVRWLKLSLVVVVGCGFLAMMLYALINRDEIRSSQVEPPLIVPPSEPLKRRPDQPGGMQIPNRDKLVFDLLDSSNTALGDTGIATGQPVSPTEALPPIPVKAEVVSETLPETDAADEADDVPAVTSVPTHAVVAPVKPVVAVTPAVVVKPVEPKIIVKEEPKKVEAKVVEKAPEKIVEAKPLPGNGKWSVQLAAVNSMADGNAMAAKAQGEFAALKGLSVKVTAVPNAKKFRVQFTGLKSREEAAAVCAKLAGKQGCFPVAP